MADPRRPFAGIRGGAWLGAVAVGLVLTLAAACTPQPELTEVSGKVMGTTYSVKVVGVPAEVDRTRLAREVDRVLNEVNERMSTYLPDSELSRLNASRDTGWVAVSPELLAVVQEAQRVSVLTGGAFDVTVGPVVNLWGFGPGRRVEQVPTDAEVEAARARVGFQYLHTRASPPALKKDRPDLYLDLSAIAKGYAVDRVAEHLEAQGLRDYLVEVGGEVRGRGRNARGTPWKVAVERPSPGEREIYGVIDVDGVGVATSGDYRNFFERGGRRYSHTMDPATGWPVTHPLTSVTVLSETAMTADGLATGLTVLGPEAGLALADREGIAALFIVRQGERLERRASRALGRYQATFREDQ